jgi:hypothetical protein
MNCDLIVLIINEVMFEREVVVIMHGIIFVNVFVSKVKIFFFKNNRHLMMDDLN